MQSRWPGTGRQRVNHGPVGGIQLALVTVYLLILPPSIMSKLPDYLKIPEDLKTHPELIKRDLELDFPLNVVSAPRTLANILTDAPILGQCIRY